MRYKIPLNQWSFSIDALDYRAEVTVPHTWNTDQRAMQYRGPAQYRTTAFVAQTLQGKRAFLYFGAVYHDAKVFVNGQLAGRHSHSGYTPFTVEITDQILPGESNQITVQVDNRFCAEMLPFENSFDWAADGGLIRSVELRFLEPDAIEFIHVDEQLQQISGTLCNGVLHIHIDFLDRSPHLGKVRITDDADNRIVYEREFACIEKQITIPFERFKLWSHHSPSLYRIAIETATDFYEVRTGLRTIEVRGQKILLNGREIYLRGCEWMPGAHPDYGMAEPLEHSIRCLRQLKNAGCVFTRFHWQQDERLLDWCDENGLLVQEEIPYWQRPCPVTPIYLHIAEQQASDMVYYHKNHPSIICWGVGNELAAETESVITYVQKMVDHFKKLDCRRLVNYVSNTLGRVENIDRDDATLHGDIAMWNEYLGLWEPSEHIEEQILQTCKKCGEKPLVISEFGLCEPHFSGGDARRCTLLRERLALYAKTKQIQGYVWFSLNDYRTHMGEAGEGKLCRRIHGSTDFYGNEKPSYRLLCDLQRQDAPVDSAHDA